MVVFKFIWPFIVLPVALFVLFLPTIIAERRNHRHTIVTAAVNFFLGWTIIGWLIALFWATRRRTS
jgi:Na+/H+-dicarboxylate symporter